MLSEATLGFGRRVMTALLGVDALYRAESGDEDGLVVLNMDTEGKYPADHFGRYGDARLCFEDLQADAASLPEADRAVYYDELCRSTLAFIRWRQGGLEFKDQLGRFLHVPVRCPAEQELDGLRGIVHILLRAQGYEGDLAVQAAAWEEKNRVPAEAVPEVLAGFLDEAWDRTEEHVFKIPAPKSDGMKVTAVSGVAYNARCDYLNRTIELNVDPTLTRPALKHLAIHEGYPGHYVQFKIRETMAAEGTAAPDVLLSVVNTASSSVFEGIADYGIEMIKWNEDNDDQIQSLLNLHRAGIGAGAAWRLHALEWPEVAVTDWLRDNALIGGEGWVQNRMRFISAPSRAALIWSYWWGEQAVSPAAKVVPNDALPDFYRFLYGRMHSIQSVSMFRGPASLPWDHAEMMSWS
jgi:hypothetical protein